MIGAIPMGKFNYRVYTSKGTFDLVWAERKWSISNDAQVIEATDVIDAFQTRLDLPQPEAIELEQRIHYLVAVDKGEAPPKSVSRPVPKPQERRLIRSNLSYLMRTCSSCSGRLGRPRTTLVPGNRSAGTRDHKGTYRVCEQCGAPNAAGAISAFLVLTAGTLGLMLAIPLLGEGLGVSVIAVVVILGFISQRPAKKSWEQEEEFDTRDPGHIEER